LSVNYIKIQYYQLFYSICFFVFAINFVQAEDLISLDFSHQRGFYTQNFDLVVNTSGYNISVKYTLDGSEPTPQYGISPVDVNSYTIANIKKTTVVRTFAYSSEDTVSTTHTYIFVDDVFSQNNNTVLNSQLNFPPIWGYGPESEGSNSCIRQNADYEMTIDACITDVDNYQQKLIDGLMEIPIMAISLDNNQIFGQDSGIYIYPVEKNTDCYAIPTNVNSWERKASIEIFNDVQGQDTLEYQVNAGLKMSGASTRNFGFYKHSFKLKFRGIYGAKKLKYPLYGDEASNEFESLQLRMIGQSTPNDERHSNRTETQYHKDAWTRQIQKQLSGFGSSPTSKFFHVFINGLYWGMYDVCERPDKDFMADYYGGEPEDYDIIKIMEVINGSDSVYNHMFDVAHSIYDTTYTNPRINAAGDTIWNKNITLNNSRIPAMYNEIKDLLDIEMFAEYILLNLKLVNADWTKNNWWAARNRTNNGKFQFFVWDAELILNYADGVKNTSIINTGLYNNTYKYHPIDLHQRLLNIPEYKIKFADQIQCHCVEEDGVLKSENLITSYKAKEQQIRNASLLEFARWGDVRSSYLGYMPFCFDVIEETLQKYETEIFPNLLKYMFLIYGKLGEDYNLFPNYIKRIRNPYTQETFLVDVYNFKAVKYSHTEGEVPFKYKLNLSNLNLQEDQFNQPIPNTTIGDIYYTTDGTDPRNADGSIYSDAIKYDEPIMIDGYKLIKARVFAENYSYVTGNIEDGFETNSIENLWTAMCPREFFPENYYDDLVINEIHYHPAPISETVSGSHLEFLEIKNTGDTLLNISNTKFTDGIKYQFPMGTTIRENEYIMLASDSLAAVNFYGTTIDGQYEGKLSNGGELLVLGRPDGIEIDAVGYEDSWDTRTDGKGSSLSLYLDRTNQENNHLEENWNSSANNFTPRIENLFCLPIYFDFNVIRPTCFGHNDGFISVNLTGGTGNLSINWLNNEGDNLITNLRSGTYEIEVTDEQSCVEKRTVTMPDQNRIISNLQITHASSINSSDGFAEVNPNNLANDYSIVWSNGSTANSINNLSPLNKYWVTISYGDATKCSITESFTVDVASTCAMPFNFSATPTSDKSAIISWSGNANNSEYTLSYKMSNETNWNEVTTSLPSILLNNLESCRYYDYKVSANCNLVSSNSSTIKTFITTTCTDYCSGEVDGKSINVTNNSAFILWDIIPNAKYILHYRKNGMSNYREYETSLNFAILFGLDNCSNYQWRIEVICSDGTKTDNLVNNFTTNGCLKKIGETFENNTYLNDNFDFQLYPNPAQSFVKISSNTLNPLDLQVLVFDLSGKMVLDGVTFTNQTTLNIESLPSGIYVAQIVGDNKNFQYRFRKD